MSPDGDRRARASLAARLFLAQGVVVAAVALAILAVGIAVGPGLFHEHLLAAGGGLDTPVVMHAELAFREAGLVSLAIGVLLGGGVALVISAVTARRLGRPLAALSSAARAVARGDYAAPLPSRGTAREVDSLLDSFAEMARRLETTESRRRRLLTDVAHELRTPISAIAVTVEALEDGVAEPDAMTLAVLRAQTARMTRLAQDLRDVSAAEEGRMELHRRPVALRELLTRAAGAAPGADVDVAGAPDVVVDVDPDRIDQVLANLLANATRHSGQGRVRVRAALRDGSAAIDVADDGDGIAPEHLAQVFDRFFRTDTARDRDHGGSGVGLTISRAIARGHGGELTAASPGRGEGATFTLTIPVPRR